MPDVKRRSFAFEISVAGGEGALLAAGVRSVSPLHPGISWIRICFDPFAVVSQTASQLGPVAPTKTTVRNVGLSLGRCLGWSFYLLLLISVSEEVFVV